MLAAVVGCATLPLSAQQLTGRVTAAKLPPGASAAPAVRSNVDRGTLMTTPAGANLAARLTARSGGVRVEAGLYLEADTVVEVLPADNLPVSPLAIQKGSLALQYTSAGEAPDLVLVTRQPAAWARIRKGSMVWVDSTGGNATVHLVSGAATLFQGAPPAGNPAEAQGGQELQAEPALLTEVLQLVNDLALAGAYAQADSWVKNVSEGPLVPPRASAPAPRGAPAAIAVAVVTPRTSIQSVVPQVLAGTAVSPTLTQAQALLTSQDPASVVVGARLERTRIVGNPGTSGSGGAVRFNPQVRPPLQLGVPLR